jgi:hypothetical protein
MNCIISEAYLALEFTARYIGLYGRGRYAVYQEYAWQFSAVAQIEIGRGIVRYLLNINVSLFIVRRSQYPVLE